MTIDRDKARWLADFYQQVADGGAPEYKSEIRGWVAHYSMPTISSNPKEWRIKPREITVQLGDKAVSFPEPLKHDPTALNGQHVHILKIGGYRFVHATAEAYRAHRDALIEISGGSCEGLVKQ